MIKPSIFLTAGICFCSATFSLLAEIPAIALSAEVDAAGTGEYAVLVAPEYQKNQSAMAAISRFAERHGASNAVYTWDGTDACLADLKRQQARYVAVVAPPQMINRVSLQTLNQISRRIDPEEDSHIDAIVGVLTANNVKNLSRLLEPFPRIELKRAVGNTFFDTELFERVFIMLDWGAPQRYCLRENGETKQEVFKDPTKSVEFFAKHYDAINPQYFLSASHATEFNLEMPFSHGMLFSAGGKFIVVPEKEMRRALGSSKTPPGKALAFSKDPKIWVAAGNCLIGDAYGHPDSMVVTALSNYGYRQFVGYTVPSWFGRGWDVHRNFFDGTPAMQLGQAWLFCMEKTLQNLPESLRKTPVKLRERGRDGPDIGFLARQISAAGVQPVKDLIGNLHDRDTIAFYGDPICQVAFKYKPTKVALTGTGKMRELTVFPSSRTDKIPIQYWFVERADVKSEIVFKRVLADGSSEEIHPEHIFTPNFVILKDDYDFGTDQALKIEWRSR
ncbi:MAG: hypothetical protein K6B46_06040 [Opitutales bacterium]|nr:hypothetical protein [Opitutales bacterium]